MPAISAEKKALKYLDAVEATGRVVKRIVIDGRRIELELEIESDELSEFDKVDMRHDKAGVA